MGWAGGWLGSGGILQPGQLSMAAQHGRMEPWQDLQLCLLAAHLHLTTLSTGKQECLCHSDTKVQVAATTVRDARW